MSSPSAPPIIDSIRSCWAVFDSCLTVVFATMSCSRVRGPGLAAPGLPRAADSKPVRWDLLDVDGRASRVERFRGQWSETVRGTG